MKKQRRSFSTGFKHEAACLVLDQGYSVPEACRSLDGIPGTVYLFNGSQLVACLPALETCAQLGESSMRKLN